MKTYPLITSLLLAPIFTTPAIAMDDSQILVSIKPLHSIVSNITKGVAMPELLLSTPVSPHTYTLKPSNALAITKAKVIFWIGPQVETFLKKPIANLNHNALVVAFPQPQTGDDHEEDHEENHEGEYKDSDGHEDNHKGHHHDGDPHVWLDPVYVQKMAKTISTALSKADPSNAAIYQANLQKTLARLQALDKSLSIQLANTNPIIVYHNAYSHLAKRYNIKIAGVLVTNPELKPSAKHISEIRHNLKVSNVKCVFSEPEFDNKTISNIFTGTHIKTGTLDPLGNNIKAGSEHYFQLMQRLAANIKNCN